jgi:hypothetical protein
MGFRVRLSTIFLVAFAIVAARALAQQVAAPSAAASSAPGQAESAADVSTVTAEQRAFAEKFVQAVEAQDVAKMRALIPPTTLKCFGGGKGKLLDRWIDDQFEYQIPKEHQINVSPIPPDMLAPSKMATYPIQRTHIMEFQYASGGGSATVTQEIGQEAGQWYAIPPCPTAARMKQFTMNERKHAIARNRAEHAYAEMKEPLKSQVITLINEHKRSAAAKLCIDKLHVDAPTAVALVEKLAGDKNND